MDDFIRLLKEWNIDLSDNQKQQFLKYYDMLIEKNKVMNLTAITEFNEVLEKHFLDSVAVVKATDLTGELSLIDIGTGAGFPGIPLKIVFPKLRVLLLDSLNKRVNFLNEVIDELGLENITAIHARAEEAGQDKLYREKFDLCVSRAVANLSTLSELCMPFVKKGGKFISYKSGNADEEIANAKKAVNLLGGGEVKCVDFVLPSSEAGRTFVVINKADLTLKKYPRKPGIPAKKPI
ncbi:MAG: 16S rRNA (guanine(527)-N(7))-methyltransferase RsmG [Eubacterium sp.]|nr:16S rRNA (guanine(527)-N(7))-methyltransferase RsmG [Eubacterium sp.]